MGVVELRLRQARCAPEVGPLEMRFVKEGPLEICPLEMRFGKEGSLEVRGLLATQTQANALVARALTSCPSAPKPRSAANRVSSDC
jgi:hypothetical protein